MNILFVVPYVPNLVRVRPYNLIRYLSACGHRVTVMTLWSTEAEREDADRLAQFCYQVEAMYLPQWRSLWNSVKALPGKTPLQADYCWQPQFAHHLEQTVAAAQAGPQRFDAIHVEHLRGVRYALHLKSFLEAQRKYQAPSIVWDSVDSISLLFRQAASNSEGRKGRLITRLELQRTERYEAKLARQLDTILLTSPRDKEAFLGLLSPPERLARASVFNVLPNGVDLDYFQPDSTLSREPMTFVVSGKMSYHANATMVLNLVRNILPLVWAKEPQVKLQVVGKDPGRELKALAEDPRVTVTGTVDDMRPYLQRATAALAPVTYSAGIQNKVLEAMACGTPVITTPVAVSALTAVPGRDLIVAREPYEFAEAILQLLHDPSRRMQLSENGRYHVEAQHNWTTIATRLAGLYQQVGGYAPAVQS